MRGAIVLVALLPLLGCGTATDDVSAGSGTHVDGDGPYEVGADIDPGVWTAPTGVACSGYSAKTRSFDLEGGDDPDGFIAGSLRVGAIQRIVLRDGEFFFSHSCTGWSREGASHRSPDPATTAGGCTILTNGDLVRKTLALGHRPSGERSAGELWALQERLEALVVARNKALGDASGQLVDYLDDPDGYNVGAGTIPKVTRAVTRIRSTCRQR